MKEFLPGWKLHYPAYTYGKYIDPVRPGRGRKMSEGSVRWRYLDIIINTYVGYNEHNAYMQYKHTSDGYQWMTSIVLVLLSSPLLPSMLLMYVHTMHEYTIGNRYIIYLKHTYFAHRAYTILLHPGLLEGVNARRVSANKSPSSLLFGAQLQNRLQF